MKRLDDGTIAIPQEQLDRIAGFIDYSLERQFDDYSNTYICECTWEEGKRDMNPDMYNMLQEMKSI